MDTDLAPSPFHADELAVQDRAGVRDIADAIGRQGIRTWMPGQQRAFFAELPLLLLGGVDATGQPWASLRFGAPGFITSPAPNLLHIAGVAPVGDPLAGAWHVGSLLGGLGLQAETRRRNRANGSVTASDADGITVRINQSFGNCSRFIRRRTPVPLQGRAAVVSNAGGSNTPMIDTAVNDTAMIATTVNDTETSDTAAASGAQAANPRSRKLSDADRALIARADTFFIASANTSPHAANARGVDVSHRGGPAGFVRVDDAVTLTTPDYNGNRFFNTLGNLTHDTRAGLLFIDYDTGDLLFVAADAEIIWDEAALADFPNAARLVRFHIREVRRSPAALPWRWVAVEG